jgi:hypothetical protein
VQPKFLLAFELLQLAFELPQLPQSMQATKVTNDMLHLSPPTRRRNHARLALFRVSQILCCLLSNASTHELRLTLLSLPSKAYGMMDVTNRSYEDKLVM